MTTENDYPTRRAADEDAVRAFLLLPVRERGALLDGQWA